MIQKATLTTFLSIAIVAIGVSQTLSLKDAVNIAHQKNLSIQKHSSYEEASYKTMQAGDKHYLPTVSLYGGYTHLSEELQLDLSQVQTSFVDGLSRQQVATLDVVNQELYGVPLSDQQKTDIYNSSSDVLNDLYPNFDARLAYQDYFMASVFVNQPIFLGGRLNQASQIEQSNYKISQYSSQQAKDIVTQRTISQYFTILLMKHVVNTRQSAWQGMVQHDSSTIHLVKAEIIPSFYEYGAKAAVSGAESRWVAANNEYEAAMTNFKNLLNLPLDTTIEPTDSLYFVDFSANIEEAQQSSITYSPLIKMNEESQSIAESNISLAKSGYLPDVFAIGEFQLYQENLPVVTPPWMVSVQMKWDIFNGGRHVNNVQAARLYQDAAEKDRDLISNELRTQVVNASARIESSKIVYLNQIKTRRLSYKNYRAIEKQYKHGLVRSNEVIDAHVLYEEAELAELEALYLYYLSVIELHALKGDLNAFIEKYEATN